MRNTKTKISLLIITFVIVLLTANVYAADIYVDAGGSNSEENGSAANPYHTITAALAKASGNPESNRQIYLKAGNYNEKVKLPDGTTFIGENKDTVIINREGLKGTTVTSGKNTTIENITVRGGNYGLVVPAHKKTTIRNSVIEKTKKIGIWIKRNNKLAANSVEIWDSTIKNNSEKGLYGQSRFIYFINNLFESNGEEGIDLRSKINGTISGNTITGNGEGGIEAEIRKVAVEISGNFLTYNGSNGITLNNRTDTGGKVIIKNNTIKNNHRYGIRCTGTKKWSKKLWKKTIKTSKNSSSDNKKKSVSPSCHSY